MSEDKEPDWLAELAKGGEAMRRQMESIVQAAEQLAARGPGRPLAQRITRAIGAGMRELTTATERPVVRDANVQGVAAGVSVIAGVGTVTASGSVVLPRMGFAGEGTVQEPDLIERNLGRILALVVLAIVTSGLLGVQGPDRATVDHYLTVIGVALSIAVLIWAGHK
jgi:hypothetical protein